MEIVELHKITVDEAVEVISLMYQLNPDIPVTPEMVRRSVEAPGTHFFALRDGSKIVGCASLCVFDSPTGRKAHVEDVVVASACRGKGLGRRLLEHLLAFARTHLGPADIFLTSRPQRVAANELYRSLGFRQKDTNVYTLKINTA